MPRRTAPHSRSAPALFALAAGSAGATNVGFLPGDAFFHTTLTKDVADGLAAGGSVTLSYDRPDDAEFMLCGYAGYWNAELPADHPLSPRLAAVYRRLRTDHEFREVVQYPQDDGSVREVETNGFRLFLYNVEYEPSRRKIGLRYNETWASDVAAFYTDPAKARHHVRLDLFMEDRLAFVRDWRDAAAGPPLKATCPPIQERPKTSG